MSAIYRLNPLITRPCHLFSLPKTIFPWDLSLYLIADRSSVSTDEEFLTRVAKCVQGGVSCVQLRDLKSDDDTCLKTALALKKILKGTGVPLVINGRPEIAKVVSAEGVYLENPELPYAQTRDYLGKKAFIGMPLLSLKEDLPPDVDYLSVKVFSSKVTRPEDSQVWGLDGLARIQALYSNRIVAIGGLNHSTIPSVASMLSLKDGYDGIAMVGDLWRSEDPEAEAKALRGML